MVDLAVLTRISYGLPPLETATTGIDAMVHAIEAYSSRHSNNNYFSKISPERHPLLSRSILRL